MERAQERRDSETSCVQKESVYATMGGVLFGMLLLGIFRRGLAGLAGVPFVEGGVAERAESGDETAGVGRREGEGTDETGRGAGLIESAEGKEGKASEGGESPRKNSARDASTSVESTELSWSFMTAGAADCDDDGDSGPFCSAI